MGKVAKCCRAHALWPVIAVDLVPGSKKIAEGLGVTVFEDEMQHQLFNPVAVLFAVNSPLDLSVDTFIYR